MPQKTEQQLKLLAEMKVPGQAVLEFDLLPQGSNKSTLVQRARFYPKGLWGIVYWNSLTPVHIWMFKGMLNKIAKSSSAKILEGPAKVKRTRASCALS